MERLNQFDILKAIGIILVIIGHTLDFNIARNIIYSFHMPLFFLVSGYFFKPKASHILIKQLIRRLLVPYLLACIVLMLLALCFNTINTKEFNLNYLSNWALSIAYGSGITENTHFQSIGPLWFLLALFWGTIMLNMQLTLQKYVSPIFTIVLCVMVSMYLYKNQVPLPLSIAQGMFCIGYLYIGYLLKQHHPSITFGSTLGLVPLAIIWFLSFKFGFLSAIQCYAHPELLTLTGALCGTYFTYLISCKISQSSNKLCSILSHIGKITLLIFCIHAIEFYFIPWQSYIKDIEINYYIANILIIAIRVFVVISIAWILQKQKIIKQIFNV